MKLSMGICFLKHFRYIRYLIAPFELQCGQIIRILFDKINLLLIVSTPEIELLMQPFIKIRFASFPNDIVFPQCPDILPNSQRRKCSDNRIADTVVVEIPFPGLCNLLAEIPRVGSQTIDDKDFL